MIILNFRNQKQIKLRNDFLDKLKEAGIQVEKCESAEENCSQYQIHESIKENMHSQIVSVFEEITEKNALIGSGFDKNIPLGCVVFARSYNDDPSSYGKSAARLYYYLQPKKIRKQRHKKYEAPNLVDSIFG